MVHCVTNDEIIKTIFSRYFIPTAIKIICTKHFCFPENGTDGVLPILPWSPFCSTGSKATLVWETVTAMANIAYVRSRWGDVHTLPDNSI